MSWRILRPVCMALIGAEAWAAYTDHQVLMDLLAVLALGTLAVAWVLSQDDTKGGGR